MVSSNSIRTRLVLSEVPDEPGRAAHWIGPMLALGTRAARHYQSYRDRQLVITVSVPSRDFAAVLIGSGWMLASEAPTLPDPLVMLRQVEPGQLLRAVNASEVITGFFSLDESVSPPRAQFAGSRWRVDCLRAVAPLDGLETPEREPRPEPGSVELMAGWDRDWDARLAQPAADLAIVGTMKWLEDDLDAYLAKESDCSKPSSIRAVLKPKTPRAATWSTRLFPLPASLTFYRFHRT